MGNKSCPAYNNEETPLPEPNSIDIDRSIMAWGIGHTTQVVYNQVFDSLTKPKTSDRPQESKTLPDDAETQAAIDQALIDSMKYSSIHQKTVAPPPGFGPKTLKPIIKSIPLQETSEMKESARATVLIKHIENMRLVLYQLDDPRYKIKNVATLEHHVFFQMVIPRISVQVGLNKKKEKQAYVLFDPSNNFNFVNKDFIKKCKNYDIEMYSKMAPLKQGSKTEYSITLQNSKQKDN